MYQLSDQNESDANTVVQGSLVGVTAEQFLLEFRNPRPGIRDLYLDLAAGYQTEAGDVAAAKRVYQEYLELFPDGKYASDVRSIMSRLEGE